MLPRISSQVDHEMRHYSFARRSNLPWNYFRRRSTDWWVVAVCAAAGAAGYLLA